MLEDKVESVLLYYYEGRWISIWMEVKVGGYICCDFFQKVKMDLSCYFLFCFEENCLCHSGAKYFVFNDAESLQYFVIQFILKVFGKYSNQILHDFAFAFKNSRNLSSHWCEAKESQSELVKSKQKWGVNQWENKK